MGSLNRIDHIVVLMLENRSFDSVFGCLYPKSAAFDGLAGTETNPGPDGEVIPVWNAAGTEEATMSIPAPDPGELWCDINDQLFGSPIAPAPGTVPTMSGFARNYAGQAAHPPGACDPRSVLHHFTPDQLPVLGSLARQFAVCDRWHASAPCQTWPNRFFVHTGTANGYENNDPPRFPYDMPTLFNRLEDAGVPWKIYFHDVPQTLTLASLWPHAAHFRFYSEFREDATRGTLPAYAFIEPRYFADLALPNDMHPPHVVTLGEQLVAEIYNVLRQGPEWLQTLLIITWDEHGGCFDHVPPPPAVPPSTTATTPFNFDRYGVRVPAVIVSPYVAPGTVVRPPGATPFDHTSIIKTVRSRFASSGPPLSDREAVAPDLDSALTLATPDNRGPPRVDALPYSPGPAALAEARGLPLNHMQQALLGLAAHLPATAAEGAFLPFIQDHLAGLRNGTVAVAETAGKDMVEAGTFIRDRLDALFSSL